MTVALGSGQKADRVLLAPEALLMVEVPTLTSISAHANSAPSAAPNAAEAAAKKTADLLAAWHALTPTQRDQPAVLEQPLSKPSAVPKSGLEASGNTK